MFFFFFFKPVSNSNRYMYNMYIIVPLEIWDVKVRGHATCVLLLVDHWLTGLWEPGPNHFLFHLPPTRLFYSSLLACSLSTGERNTRQLVSLATGHRSEQSSLQPSEPITRFPALYFRHTPDSIAERGPANFGVNSGFMIFFFFLT